MVLGIYGAGGLGRETLDMARFINSVEKKWDAICFLDDFEGETAVNGAEVLAFESFKARFPADSAKAVIAVGEPKVRRTLREKVKNCGYGLQTLVHPTAFTGMDARLGEGVIVQFGCFVSCNTLIGENVLFQPNSSVGHDSTVGIDSVVSSYVGISGNCVIGERVYIGVSVAVKEHTAIGADSIVGMGSAVLRDIPENVIAIGSPARVMKNNEDGRVFK
jgi:sugar O-acyltransferase (sialic acid O-acetyltransferase NeuD family)